MIVLDANILIRAVLGRRVRQLFETYSGRGVRFYTPDIAFAEVERYLPSLLEKRAKAVADVGPSLQYLHVMVEWVDREVYGVFETEARRRLRGRDEDDWRRSLPWRLQSHVLSGLKISIFSELVCLCGLQTVLKFSSKCRLRVPQGDE
jgi:hypothetical protein